VTALPLSITRAAKAGIILAPLVLMACQQGGITLPDLTGSQTARPPVNPPPAPSVARSLTSAFNGQKVGNGPIRLSLLVPQSASGGAGQAGKQIANAARLAVRDFGTNSLQVIIKDTKGQAATASSLASEARNEGSSLILGPLFSASVSASSAVSVPANIPMIAFSSDVKRARAGVYLLSFSPNGDIRRTLTYGFSVGANRVVALLPNTAYGQLAEQELRRTYDRNGGQVVSVVRYARDSNAMITAARSIALPLSNANAIYIPDGGQAPSLILNSLRKAGVSLEGKTIMGSGQWSSVNKNDRVLNGAFYAGPDRRNFDRFARRYQSAYGSRPTFNAALGYDAVSLASELVRRNRQSPFNPAAIQSRSGFNGATGIFRFEANGRVQRGLVVNKIENGQVRIVSPSPTSFAGSG